MPGTWGCRATPSSTSWSSAPPRGAWNQEALPHVIEAGYRAAFQLSDHPQDPANPLLTIRRIMPSPAWDGPTLLARLESEFPRA